MDTDAGVLTHAKAQFGSHGLHATTIVADVQSIPKPDGSYSIVFSYGLMEHFSDVRAMISEQLRVLKKGGLLLAYVVDGSPNENIRFSDMYDTALSYYGEQSLDKAPVHRNGFKDRFYRASMEQAGLADVSMQWVYPIPMVSPQTEFPFTLNPPDLELKLTSLMARDVRHFGWTCGDGKGQAFIVWGWKR